jgi:hypothetical protein
MRFAHLKTHHCFERMRLRGLFGARDRRLHQNGSSHSWRAVVICAEFSGGRPQYSAAECGKG